MSREAWGDEGNVAELWEDTAMRQEWDRLRKRFNDWQATFHKDFDPEHDSLVRVIECAMDRLELAMEGRL
jgi:hypothetical protein